MNKREKFNLILKKIKSIKIQGAENVAKSALKAYLLFPTLSSKRKILSLRPTEPMLKKVLEEIEYSSLNKILFEIEEAKKLIKENSFKIIKNSDVIFTHCHSSSVVESLVYAKKKGKKFEVYNTETRPLFQGRKTFSEISKSGIKITQFVDSAAMIALTHTQGTKKVSKVLFGADAILNGGVINKVGSGMFAKIAHDNKIPVYILANSWKYTKENIKLEKRGFKEVWNKILKKSKIENPSFEFIPKKYITAIISEKGILSYNEFLKRIN